MSTCFIHALLQMIWVGDMTCSVLPVCSPQRLILQTISSPLLPPCLSTRLSYCVSALLSWQQNHVTVLRSWQQCRSPLLLRRRADLFLPLDLSNAKHLKTHYTQDESLQYKWDRVVAQHIVIKVADRLTLVRSLIPFYLETALCFHGAV